MSNPQSVNGLSPGTTYEFYVQSICAADSGFSAWVGPVAFTTSACAHPTDLAATNITANTADLSWTEMGTATAWHLEYGPAGFDRGSGTTTEAEPASNPQSVNGLNPGTTYEFYVQSICGADQSAWVGPFAFTTATTALSK